MADEELRVPNADDGYQGDELWHLREQVKTLGEKLVQLQGQLNRERLERDHWFQVATDLRKIALNLSEHVG